MLVTVTQGSEAYVKGLMIGIQARSLIRWNTARAKKRLLTTGHVDQVLSSMRRWASLISGDALEELRGMAVGAGVTLEDILLLNYAGEFLHPDECTAAVIPASQTMLGAPILWKNRDMGSRWMQHQVVVLEEGGDNTYGFAAITTAGHRGVAMGINEKGLAVENTYVFAGKYANPRPEWGNLWLMRLILEKAGSIEEAYRIIASTPGKYSGSSFLMVDSSRAAVIDVVGDELQVATYADEGFIVRTNHWEPVAPRELWSYEVNKKPEESVKRYEAAYRFLAGKTARGRVGFRDVSMLARNTANGPTPSSPCRFPRKPGAPKEAVDESTTLSAAIMIPFPRDPELSVMWAALGNPLLTLFTPILVAARRYGERSVELENAERFASEAPRLAGLTGKEIMARLKELSEPWLASIMSSAEPWLSAERLREITYGGKVGGAEAMGRALLSAWMNAEQILDNWLHEAVYGEADAVEATRILVEKLGGEEQSLLEKLGGFGEKGLEASIHAARIFTALHAALKADSWGLWKHVGGEEWMSAGKMILEAFHGSRSLTAELASSL